MKDWLREIFKCQRSTEKDIALIWRVVRTIPTRFTQLERLIMATAEELAARIDAATNEVASDLQSVKDALAAAVANADASVQAAVNAELAKLDAPIARLEALGTDPANPVPDPEPTPDEPAPVDPSDGGVDVDENGNPV